MANQNLPMQDDFDEDSAKRQKLNMPMVDAKRVEALSPLIRCLGAEVLDGGDTTDEATVPRVLLKAMEAKVCASFAFSRFRKCTHPTSRSMTSKRP